MELLTTVKQTLVSREQSILSLEKKLNRSQSLNKTLLTALERSIGGDILSYDERDAIRQETKDLCKGIDNEVKLQQLEQDNRIPQ